MNNSKVIEKDAAMVLYYLLVMESKEYQEDKFLTLKTSKWLNMILNKWRHAVATGVNIWTGTYHILDLKSVDRENAKGYFYMPYTSLSEDVLTEKELMNFFIWLFDISNENRSSKGVGFSLNPDWFDYLHLKFKDSLVFRTPNTISFAGLTLFKSSKPWKTKHGCYAYPIIYNRGRGIGSGKPFLAELQLYLNSQGLPYTTMLNKATNYLLQGYGYNSAVIEFTGLDRGYTLDVKLFNDIIRQRNLAKTKICEASTDIKVACKNAVKAMEDFGNANIPPSLFM